MRLITGKKQKEAAHIMAEVLRAYMGKETQKPLDEIDCMDTVILGMAELAYIVGGVKMMKEVGQLAGMLDEQGRCRITEEEP